MIYIHENLPPYKQTEHAPLKGTQGHYIPSLTSEPLIGWYCPRWERGSSKAEGMNEGLKESGFQTTEENHKSVMGCHRERRWSEKAGKG